MTLLSPGILRAEIFLFKRNKRCLVHKPAKTIELIYV